MRDLQYFKVDKSNRWYLPIIKYVYLGNYSDIVNTQKTIDLSQYILESKVFNFVVLNQPYDSNMQTGFARFGHSLRPSGNKLENVQFSYDDSQNVLTYTIPTQDTDYGSYPCFVILNVELVGAETVFDFLKDNYPRWLVFMVYESLLKVREKSGMFIIYPDDFIPDEYYYGYFNLAKDWMNDTDTVQELKDRFTNWFNTKTGG